MFTAEYFKKKEMIVMKKRALILTAVAVCAASAVIGASTSSLIKNIQCQLRPDFTVVIDGVEQTFKDADGNVVYPVLYDGTTYLPVRAIGELMNKTVYWYEDEKRIELKSEGSTVTDADVIIPSGGSGTQSAADSASVSLDKAKEIAVSKAGFSVGDVNFTKNKLDYDNGRLEYEIEFRKDNTKYSADIDAQTGEILSWDIEAYGTGSSSSSGGSVAANGDIGSDEAVRIALEKAGLSEADVTRLRTEKDYDNGRLVYEIEFYQGRTEYSAEILASDGSIVSWDVDYD